MEQANPRRIILAIEIAVLGEGPITEVRPQTVNCPSFGREELALIFESSICIPVLRGEYQTTERFSAARIYRTAKAVRELKLG